MRIITNAKAAAGGIEAYETRLFLNIQQAVHWSMGEVVKTAVAYIRRRDVIASGSLLSSIASEVDHAINRIIGSAGTNLSYAEAVHEGTRPHFPPIQPIEEWVAQKVRRGQMSTGNIRSTAFLIARKISKVGTRGQPFLEVSLRANRRRMIQRVAKEIESTR